MTSIPAKLTLPVVIPLALYLFIWWILTNKMRTDDKLVFLAVVVGIPIIVFVISLIFNTAVCNKCEDGDPPENLFATAIGPAVLSVAVTIGAWILFSKLRQKTSYIKGLKVGDSNREVLLTQSGMLSVVQMILFIAVLTYYGNYVTMEAVCKDCPPTKT